MPSCLRAAFTAFPHLFIFLFFAKAFMLAADAARLTILPCLFFLRSPFFKPPEVFSFLQLFQTDARARLPVAILETFIALRRMDFFFIPLRAFMLRFFMLRRIAILGWFRFRLSRS